VQSRFDDILKAIKLGVQDAEANGIREFNVGAFCEIGKHRSVSIVEELKIQRFDHWNVVVRHRDVHLKSSKKRHKKARQDDSHENNLAFVCPSSNVAVLFSQ
jgi:hypothetical protein